MGYSVSAHTAVKQRIREAATISSCTLYDRFDSPITGKGVGKIDANCKLIIWMQHENYDYH